MLEGLIRLHKRGVRSEREEAPPRSDFRDSLDRTAESGWELTSGQGVTERLSISAIVAFLMRSSGQSLAVRSSVPFLSGSVYKSPAEFDAGRARVRQMRKNVDRRPRSREETGRDAVEFGRGAFPYVDYK